MGYLPHVQKGEALSARKENQRIDAINALADRLDSLWLGGGRTGALRVTVSNGSSAAVPSGGVLAVTGCRASGSFDKMKSLWLNGSIPLSGAAVARSTALPALALEGIPAGKIGRALVPDLLAVTADEMRSSDGFVTFGAGKLVTSSNGLWRILARSEANDDDQIFALVYPLKPGHRVCTTSGWNGTATGENWSANVTIDGATVSVKCPLLRSGESIANGTTVIVSWNGSDNVWQVIEAQCPGS